MKNSGSEVTAYLVPGLKDLDLLEVLSVGTVSVVQGGFELTDVGLVLLLEAVEFRLVASLNLNKGTLELFDGALAALPGDTQMANGLG